MDYITTYILANVLYLKGTALTIPIGEYLVEKLPALPVADPM